MANQEAKLDNTDVKMNKSILSLVEQYASCDRKSAELNDEREDVYEDKPGVTTNTAYGAGLGVRLIERRPATPDAERWQGWGTALKPAFEPIVVGRKPLAGTVAANVLEYGTGALNIDATRVATADDTAPFSVSSQTYSPHSPYEQYSQAIQYAPVTTIQYPDYAINIHSPEAVASTKKEMTVDSRPSQSYRAEQGQTQTSGVDWTMIALIAGVALVAYGVVTR